MIEYSTDGSLAERRATSDWWHRRYGFELVVVYLIGVAVSQFIYSATGPGTGLRTNLAGNDCFCHVKFAAMLPETGLLDALPWMSQTIFRDEFTSHYYGFHVLLSPFVLASHALKGDYLLGARWAMSLFFGLNLILFMLILMSERIRFRWLFLLLFLLMPPDFFIRHAYVRALDLSLMFTLLGSFFILRGRYIAAGVTLFLYTQVYLGSFFLVIIAGIHFVSGLLDRPKSTIDWRLVIAIAVGGLLGFVIHPYFPGTIHYLETQIFGSGLTPDIPVGREWNSYKNVWSFVNTAGAPFLALLVAIVLRFRLGRRLSRNQWTMFVASLFFLVLVLKARRFVEYWPVYSLLAAALIGGPVFGFAPLRREKATRPNLPIVAELGILLATLLVVAGVLVQLFVFGWEEHKKHVEHVLSWWWVWAALAILYFFTAVPLRTLGFTQAQCSRSSDESVSATNLFHPWVFVVRLTSRLSIGVVCLFVFLLIGGVPLDDVRGWAKGKYNLDAVEEALTLIADQSEPGDIVFADDWDVFPVFFYFNDKNYYILGLDPVYALRHDPEMYARFQKISRGQTPTLATYKAVIDGKEVERKVRVKLTDIRDRFNAKFAIADKEHLAFARKLDKATNLAERILPPPGEPYGEYNVYRILPKPE